MSFMTAAKLSRCQNPDIEVKYLEGSRMAWRLAEYHKLDDGAILDKICIGGVHVTPRKILARGGLSEKEIMLCAKELNIADILDNQINYSETKGYKDKLSASEYFLPMVRQHSVKAFDLTYAYFRQEGLTEGEEVCVVDSGWVGSMQQTLGNLIDKEVEGYYFGLYELPSGADPTKYHTFCFAPYVDINKKVHFSNCLFESVFSAPEGMTCGYELDGNSIVAVKETDNNPNKDRIAENAKLLERLTDDEEYVGRVLSCDKDAVIKRLMKLMSHPSADEAECIGTYLFSDDISRTSLQELALGLSLREIKNTHVFRRALLMKGLISGSLKDSAWLEGSIVRCGKAVGFHLLNCRIYKRLIYIRKRLKSKGRK